MMARRPALAYTCPCVRVRACACVCVRCAGLGAAPTDVVFTSDKGVYSEEYAKIIIKSPRERLVKCWQSGDTVSLISLSSRRVPRAPTWGVRDVWRSDRNRQLDGRAAPPNKD